jgi:hypothetical protein
MLDTVKLSLEEYSISSDSSLTIQPGTYMAGTGEVITEFPLFTDKSGRAFRGSKAYLNTEKLNLTLQPFSRGGAKGTACFVSFSIPKLHYGNNFYSVGEGGSRAVLKSVEKELKENGITTNIEQAHISRADTFKNIQAEEPFSSYFSLFTLLRARRAQQRSYGTTYLVHNKQQQFCIYDKLVEMESRKIDTKGFPARTIRFEHRLLNKRKVAKVYGFSQVGELFKGGYEVVRNNQVEEWRKSLFSHEVEEVSILAANQLENEMRYFQERHSRNWFSQFLKVYGAYSLVEGAGLEVVKTALHNLESERTKVWRAERLLLDMKREVDMLRVESGSSKTQAELYNELKAKVCLN